MNNNCFCHLHNHMEFSQLDGFGTAKDHIKRAKELGFKYLACTEHGNVDGLIKFQRECDKQGIKPILGCELYIVPSLEAKVRKNGHITVWVKNEQGWKTLCNLLTHANTKGFYYKPRIGYADLLNANLDGLIIGTACAGSFLRTHPEEAGGLIKDLFLKIPNDLYLELQPHDFDDQYELHEILIDLHDSLEIPYIVSNDCHYILEEDAKAHEVLLAMQTGKKWYDEKRMEFPGGPIYYLKSADEMMAGFKKQDQFTKPEILTAMRNTLKIARECCDFRIPKQDILLPWNKEDGVPDILLADIVKEGLMKLVKQNKIHEIMIDEYRDRIKEELAIISKKKFSIYFLIVFDVVNWCREQGILVGPGRGSVGGSVVAYLTGITQIDPIEHGLIFSRFISEYRADYPDIDLDFEDTRRGEVVEYVIKKYGEWHTAGISSFSTMKARGVIRDVSRVFNVEKEVDEFAKAISKYDKDKFQVAKYAEESEEGKAFDKKHPEIVDIACMLENQVKNPSQHPAGVIISKEDLRDTSRCVLCKRKKNLVVNWDMEDTDYSGLMKLDILGLNNLTIISGALKRIEDNIDISAIPLTDEKVFRELTKGNTMGVFQFNTHFVTEITKKVRIGSFENMSAVVALARPGPFDSGMTDLYIERKNSGKGWKRKHPIYEKITEETYGVIVYQEQVMKVVSEMAGLSYSIADKIRKIVGKKRDATEFEQYWDMFLQGCLKTKTMDEAEAEEFWEGLRAHANYSFNKCLTGDTEVIRSSAGKHCKSPKITIKELFDNFNSKKPIGWKLRNRGLKLLQIQEDGRIRPGQFKGVYHNGKKEVYQIKTEKGKTIKATNNHRFLTDKGYKEVKELKESDNLIVMGDKEPVYIKKGCQTERARGKKYSGKGFLGKENNVSWIDGRDTIFKQSKKEVRKRSKDKCEQCSRNYSDELRFEFAHIDLLEFFDGDYTKYNSPNNLKFLCNGCHKKLDYKLGVRKKRWTKGRVSELDEIVSIQYCGVEDVYDIEMEGPDHNFIANDIVSHNSHSVGYAMIAYWTTWLRVNYPHEYICSALTYGKDDKKEKLLEEAWRVGLTTIPPKVGISSATEWIIKDDQLYVPFSEIKGIGPSKAKECAGTKTKEKKQAGFFNLDDIQEVRRSDAVEETLKAIDAYNPRSSLPRGSSNMFDFKIK